MTAQQALNERPLSKTQLFCSNLPWSVNGKILRQAFEAHGTVTDAFVAYNGRSSRGFGYVTFAEPAAAAAAVKAMNGTALNSEENGEGGGDDRQREIRVEMARERPGPRPEPRERPERRDRGDGQRDGNRGERGEGRGGRGGRGGGGDRA